MAYSENRQLMEVWSRRVWGEQDAAAIDDLYASTGELTGLGFDDHDGPEAFRLFHAKMCALLSDTSLVIGDYLEQGDRLFCNATYSATGRETNRTATIEGSILLDFADGKIARAENYFDFLSFFEQLGLLPEGAFMRLLQGEKLAG